MAADITKFLKDMEGYSATPYKDENDFTTIGYGANLDAPTTLKTMDSIGMEEVKTQEDAEKLMQAQLAEKKKELQRTIPNYDTMPSGQQNALLSLMYNNPKLIGSQLREHISKGDTEAAAKEILLKSNKAESGGLAKRRIEEAAMFNGGQLPPLQEEERQKIIKQLEAIRRPATKEATKERFQSLLPEEQVAAASAMEPNPNAVPIVQPPEPQMPLPPEIAEKPNLNTVFRIELEKMRRREAAKKAKLNDTDRQKGLNAIPFDPAINPYIDNAEWNPQLADNIKQLGTPASFRPSPADFPLPSATPPQEETLAPLMPSGVDEAIAANSQSVESSAIPVDFTLEDLENPPDDFLQRLKEAQGQKRKDQMLDAILRASTQIGTAISGQGNIRPDYSAIDAFKPLIGRDLEDLKEMEGAKREQDKFTTASDMSKLANQSVVTQLRKIGSNALADKIEKKNLSYDQLTKVFGQTNLQNMVSQYEAAENRLAIAKERDLSKKEKDEDKKSQRKDSFTQDLRKELTGSGVIGKAYANYMNADRAYSALSEFAKNPTGYSDYASLMGSLKALQGDDSVVREAEMRLGVSATSLANKVRNWSDSIISGRTLQPEQRKQMIKSIEILADVAKRQFERASAPVLAQADSLGIDRKQLLGEMGIKGASSSVPASAPMVFDPDAAAKELQRRKGK